MSARASLPISVLPGGLDEARGAAVQFFTEAELRGLEAAADSLHAKAGTRLPPTAFHQTHALGGALRRTKMFFGARCQPLALPVHASHLWCLHASI